MTWLKSHGSDVEDRHAVSAGSGSVVAVPGDTAMAESVLEVILENVVLVTV